VTQDGEPLAATIREQSKVLSLPRVVSEVAFEAYRSIASVPPEPKTMMVSSSNAETVSKRIKESVSVLEFVSQYIVLDERGRGHCPFHDDQHASFVVNPGTGVNDKKGYWHCFAGCGGGSTIDFWSKWREKYGEDPGFVPTITKLAEMLLI
jgi:hypothetical protein